MGTEGRKQKERGAEREGRRGGENEEKIGVKKSKWEEGKTEEGEKVDVRVAYIRKLAILGDRDHIVTANYSPVLCSYLWGPLDLNP